MNSVATEQLWVDFDLNSAVFLDYIAHWVHLNSSNKQPRNFHEGRYWTYNTLDALHSIFPGWPKETIRNIIRKCVKNGLLIVSNFNKNKYDRTNWYTLSDYSLKYYPKLSHLIHKEPDSPYAASCVDFTSQSGISNTPIPKPLTTSSNNTITTSEFHNSHSSSNLVNEESSDYPVNGYDEENAASVRGVDNQSSVRSDYFDTQKENEAVLSKDDHGENGNRLSDAKSSSKRRTNSVTKEVLMEYIDVYREVFPNNPQPHKRVISTSLQKTLSTLIKRWPELDPEGKPITVSSFQRYLILLKETAPRFSLGEYMTEQGNKKKNGLETFARWNTIVKFLEKQYS